MCQQLDDLRKSIVAFGGRFEADALTPAQASEVVGACATIEASIASVKALAAARAAEGNGWQDLGYRSAAHQLADQAGMSPSSARRALDTGRRMGRQPEVAKAALAGELSAEQAAAVSDGAAADPSKALELIEKAKTVSVPELNEEVARTKALVTDQDARRRAIHAKRSLRRWTDRDGAFQAHLYGHPEDGAGMWQMLDPIRRHLNTLRRDNAPSADTNLHESFETLDYDSLMALAMVATGHDDGELSLVDLFDLGLFPQLDIDAILRSGAASFTSDPPEARPRSSASGAAYQSPGSGAPRSAPSDSRSPESEPPSPRQPSSRPPSPRPPEPVAPRPPESEPPAPEPVAPGSPGLASNFASDRESSSLCHADAVTDPPKSFGHSGLSQDTCDLTVSSERREAFDAGDTFSQDRSGVAICDSNSPTTKRAFESAESSKSTVVEKAVTKGRQRRRLVGSPTRVMVRVDLDALLRGVPIDGELCEIPGYGPIPVSTVKALMDNDNAVLVAMLTKGKEVVGVYHHRRRPNAYQQSALDFLYPACAVAGCSARASLQYDHREDWAKTKVTVFDLLDRLCTHHHALKTRKGWALVDGTGKRAFVSPGDPRHPKAKSATRGEATARSRTPSPSTNRP